MTIQDDRTDEQKKSHPYIVVARDNFMSGWGGASGGFSRCAWAVPAETPWHFSMQEMEKWVRSRPEMRYVNVVDLNTYRPPPGTAHFRIYVAEPGTHPALRHPALAERGTA